MKRGESRVREPQFSPRGSGRWTRAIWRRPAKSVFVAPTGPQFTPETLGGDAPTATVRGPGGGNGWDVDAAMDRVTRTGLLGGVADTPSRMPRDVHVESSIDRPFGSMHASHASTVWKSQVGFVLLWFAVVATATLAAYLYVSTKPKVYGASVDVLYSVGVADSVADDRQLATQVALARSRAVLNPVAQEIGGVTVDQLEKALEVKIVANSAVLRFTVADLDAGRALALVESVARHYVLTSVQQNDPSGGLDVIVEDIRRTVDQRLAELESQTAQSGLRQQLQPPLSDNGLATETRYVQARLVELQGRLDDAQLDRRGSARPRMLSDAYVLGRPLSPRPLQGVAAGSLVGIFVATGAVVGLWALRSWDSGAWRKVP